jgi:hypothetical protein
LVSEVDGRVVGFISLLGHEVSAVFVDPGSNWRSWAEHEPCEESSMCLRGTCWAEHSTQSWSMHQKAHNQTCLEAMRLRLAANDPRLM